MALVQCGFSSEVLGMSVSMNVIIPNPSYTRYKLERVGNSKLKLPVLYLLHGLSDDHSMWLRNTSIERYVDGKNLIVVMPTVYRGFYTDMKNGPDYWTFISEELPHVVQSLFPASNKREDNFAAGLSMGGYGAFKLGLRKPDSFAAVASLSGALDILTFEDDDRPLTKDEFQHIFGSREEASGSADDLFALAGQLKQEQREIPKLFQSCGTEDFLYSDNLHFLEHLQQLGIEVTYEEEFGAHNWNYWEKQIKRVIEWLPIQSRASMVAPTQ